jgi:hypothetical protein
MIFLVLTFLQFSLAFVEKKEIRVMEIKNALLFSALAIFYQVFLLFLYMFFFGNYEGVRCAALVRYSGSFFLCWTIIVLAQVIRKISLYKHSTFGISIISVSLILLAPSILFSEVRGRYTDLVKLPARLDVEKLIPKSLENQRELILQIESFLDVTSILIAKYKNKKNEILILKQAILKQAFNNKLVKAA